MDKEGRAKIVLPEKLFMFFVCFFADVFEFAATAAELIPFVGPLATFAKIFGNLMTWPIIQGWLFFRGGRGKWAIARNIIFAVAELFEFVPFLNGLPLRTVSLIIVFILLYLEDHLAEAAAVVESAVPAARTVAKAAQAAAAVVK